MSVYWRPIPEEGGVLPLAGGWLRFSRLERLERGGVPPRILPADTAPPEVLSALTAPRAPVMGVGLDRPSVMGIVNATPDSFSDGGTYDGIAWPGADRAGRRCAGYRRRIDPPRRG